MYFHYTHRKFLKNIQEAIYNGCLSEVGMGVIKVRREGLHFPFAFNFFLKACTDYKIKFQLIKKVSLY